MERLGKWQLIKSLGAGGQGEVFLALDTNRVNPEEAADQASRAVAHLAGIHEKAQRRALAEQLAIALKAFDSLNTPANLGALKVLHKPRDPAGYDKAKTRMEREVSVYESVQHRNLLRILDKDLTNDWFVTEYHSHGPLSDHLERYRGNLLGALRAIRPIVDAVAQLHWQRFVHRDIKPENIFLGSSDDLVLGDAGLVFFTDDQRTRASDTFENVGSRDWMPAWAMGMRVEDIRPTFDVFSLGKLLWSMVSGRPILQLWYIHRQQFELEQMFPGDLNVRWARFILDRCVIEDEKDCLTDATEMLPYIDRAILALSRHAQVVREGIQRLCTVCALGAYRYVSNENLTAENNFGLRPSSAGELHKIFACDHCGHVEIFYIPPDRRPPAWPERPAR